MSLHEDFKSVLKELSPILAGFKLALIVTGWFGLGSVAQWVITRWYPFTRWVWDQVTLFLSLPVLPIVIKDSLTALIFFLPLGIGALLRRKVEAEAAAGKNYRFVAALFGVVFLFLICKEVFESILRAIQLRADAAQTFISKLIEPILTSIQMLHPVVAIGGFGLYISFIVIFAWKTRKDQEMRRRILKLARSFYFGTGVISGIASSAATGIGVILISTSGGTEDSAVLFALAILFFIVALLAMSVAYAPRKLYITSGAAIAFVLAAIMFDLVVAAIGFIESIPA